jgi:hypothetical protein
VYTVRENYGIPGRCRCGADGSDDRPHRYEKVKRPEAVIPTRRTAPMIESPESGTAPEGYERVPIEDWSAIEEHLRRAAGRDAIEASDAEISLHSGSARFVVTTEGDVNTGMPLHGFATEGVDALYVDAVRGRIRVYGPNGLDYEFRIP